MHTYDLKKIRADLNQVAYKARFDGFDVSQGYRDLSRATQCAKAVETHIGEMMAEIGAMHQQKNKLDKLIAEGQAAIDDFKARQYEARRKIAAIAISNESLRIQIFSRDGWACKHCSTKENLSIDHIIPVKRGGGNEPENLQALCIPCNSSKGAKLGVSNHLSQCRPE